MCRKSLALYDMPLRLTPVHVSIVVHLVSWKVVNHTQTFLGALIRRIPRGRVSRVLTPVARVQVDNFSNRASESSIFPSRLGRRQKMPVSRVNLGLAITSPTPIKSPTCLFVVEHFFVGFDVCWKYGFFLLLYPTVHQMHRERL